MLVCAAAAVMACWAPAAVAAPTGPLSQKGRWITDAKGRVAIMHGVNLVYKRPPYAPVATGFGADDARFLRKQGFDTVRLGVIYKGVEPSPGRYSDSYLDQIASTARTLAKAGVFYQLDFHQDLYNERYQGEGWPDWAVHDDGLPAFPKTGFPNNYLVMPALNRAFDHFWSNDFGLQDRYAAAWRHVAARFRGQSRMMGYDILNEPWPGNGWQACASPAGCDFDRTKLTPFYRRVARGIRAVDGRNIIWSEPNVLFNFGAGTRVGALGGRTGTSFHVYCLQDGAPTCDSMEKLPFSNADKQAERTGSALMLTEFGATDDLDTINRVVGDAQDHMVSWMYWHYCPCRDPTTTGAGDTQALVLDPRKPPTGSNVRAAKLRTLSRAYPQAIAGTPTSYRFDAAAKRFDLRYSTRRLGGGRFARGADTQVFVPRIHFTRGYDVKVTGGEAISKPNSQTLHVRNCTGRSAVRVTVTAGTGRRTADCRAPRYGRKRFRLTVSPRRARVGRAIRFRFRATVRRGRHRRGLKGVRIRFGSRSLRTDRRGRASFRGRLSHGGRYRARARKNGYRRVVVRVTVRRAAG